jgi:16S rRNA C1402 (ribose-2'-O) methylase RsmI
VSYQFAGSDFVRGIVRVGVTAAASAGTALAVAFQSSPDGGTTWYPSAAGLPFASTPGYQTVTAAIAAASQWAFPLTTFPGALFRLAVLVTGGTGLTVSATGDFQKVVPDNT